MATGKKTKLHPSDLFYDGGAPENLEGHMFYGLRLNEEQTAYRDAIYSNDKDIVFCNAKAGTGKTLIAVATAMLMWEYKLIDEIYYVSAAGMYEGAQGLLPGTLEEKSLVYQVPLRQALMKIGFDPERVVCSERNMMAMKDGSACITAITDGYLRGVNLGSSDRKTVIILDEAQNYTRKAIRTALTRVCGDAKVIVIGEVKQCDLKYPQDSGFDPAMQLFKEESWCQICNLTQNYRGRISAKADEL